MSRSTIHSFEDLPVTLCAPQVAAALGISKSCAYTLMHRGDFPKRMIVSKAKFLAWLESQDEEALSSL